MTNTQQAVIKLLNSALTGQKRELPADFSMEEVCTLMRKQGVLPLAYVGALNCGVSKAEPVMQQLFQSYLKYMLRSEKQMRAVDELLRQFEENGIDYMPLKGCNLKPLYPKSEMRLMGDADILIRTEQSETIKSLMQSLGYKLTSNNEHVYNWDSEDLHVELHKSLCPPVDADYYAYYGTGWRFALKQEGHRYAMSNEDEFVFIFGHFARHYRMAGIGCRQVADLYVYRSHFPQMDEHYIHKELRKLRLDEFYDNMLRTLDLWFEEGEGDAITELISSYVLGGGAWGSIESSVHSKEVKSAKKKGRIKATGIKATLRALFPPRSSLVYTYNVLSKAPYLLPVVWVIRAMDVLFHRRYKIKKKMKVLRAVSDEAILSRQQALNAVGLDFNFDN